MTAIQEAMMYAMAAATVVFAFHKFFIGDLSGYADPERTQILNRPLQRLRDLHSAGIWYGIFYKPLGGCLYCLTFWATLPFFITFAVKTGNYAFILSPFISAVTVTLIKKSLEQ